MSFLLVDGSRARWSRFRAIMPRGANVWTAETIGEGIDKAATHRPAVIVVAAVVVRLDAMPAIPLLQEASHEGAVILTTARYDQREAERAATFGVFSYLQWNDDAVLRGLCVAARQVARGPRVLSQDPLQLRRLQRALSRRVPL